MSDDVSDRDTLAQNGLAGNLEKRVFDGHKRFKRAASTSAVVSAFDDEMSELVDFILDHEEAFQR